ncbi:hypothetical protein TcasGA2_TC005294 [Tribolium castaneum]|uniref:Uncharacterized protein n=1 Tax=Tribolium castaneum TaxID=7070 RepID=D7ELE1_TRICA|nr:hypothetical protein TcasGA2_TC005294 [Tribolium castaneum]
MTPDCGAYPIILPSSDLTVVDVLPSKCRLEKPSGRFRGTATACGEEVFRSWLFERVQSSMGLFYSEASVLVVVPVDGGVGGIGGGVGSRGRGGGGGKYRKGVLGVSRGLKEHEGQTGMRTVGGGTVRSLVSGIVISGGSVWVVTVEVREVGGRAPTVAVSGVGVMVRGCLVRMAAVVTVAAATATRMVATTVVVLVGVAVLTVVVCLAEAEVTAAAAGVRVTVAALLTAVVVVVARGTEVEAVLVCSAADGWGWEQGRIQVWRQGGVT